MTPARIATIILGLLLLAGAAFAEATNGTNSTNATATPTQGFALDVNGMWNTWTSWWTTQPLVSLVPFITLLACIGIAYFVLRLMGLTITHMIIILIILVVAAVALGWKP